MLLIKVSISFYMELSNEKNQQWLRKASQLAAQILKSVDCCVVIHFHSLQPTTDTALKWMDSIDKLMVLFYNLNIVYNSN